MLIEEKFQKREPFWEKREKTVPTVAPPSHNLTQLHNTDTHPLTGPGLVVSSFSGISMIYH